VLAAVLVPTMFALAGLPRLSLTPSTAAPGATVAVQGTAFDARIWVQLALDHQTAGLPVVRTDDLGAFSLPLTLTADVSLGEHEVAALQAQRGRAKKPRGGASLATGTVIASATLVVASPSTNPSPSVPAPTSPPPSVAPSSTSVPTASASPPGDPQPQLPVRAAFYYPWFPEAWRQQGLNPFSRFQPSLGWYDSSDPSLLAAHLEAMEYAHIQVGIASWWGPGSRSDARLPTILAASAVSSVHWTIYYEPEGQGDPSVSQLAADLAYLQGTYGADPRFLRLDGRFVVFVFADAGDGCATADRWSQANRGIGAYVVLKVFSGYRTCANQPDGWHQYAPALAADSQPGYSYAISPGFWKANEAAPRLPRDPARWARNVRDMVASGAPFQLVTTFNEWGEGTSAESAAEWASPSGFGLYLDVLHHNGLPDPSPPPSPTPTAAPTPATTATPAPTPAAGSTAVLVGAGDIASCDSAGDEATAALLDGMAGIVFTTGDNVYESGTTAEFVACYEPSWGRHRARTRPSAGNHDWLTANAQGYRDAFGISGPTYTAYDAGTWRIYVLDSNCSKVAGCGPGSPQYSWLASDLAAHPRACVAAYWHHPKFTIGPHADDEGGSGVFWQLLHDHGVDLIINGHDHNYQRWTPMRPDGTADPAGIRLIINGAGGKNHTTPTRSDARVEAGNHDTYGVLQLTLSPGAYSWAFVPEAGKTFTDAGTTSCH